MFRAARALQWEAKRVFVQSELLHSLQGMVNPRSSLDWDRLLELLVLNEEFLVVACH